MSEDENQHLINAEVDRLATKIEQLLKREQPPYELATWALINVGIGVAIDRVGMDEHKVRLLFSHMLEKYLIARGLKSPQHNT
jgi:hypothetical protein